MGEEAGVSALTCAWLLSSSPPCLEELEACVDDDHRYMRRAIALAQVPAFTSPNPRVGAVVVRAGAIVSEGAHQGAGTPHAEAVALDSADATGATLYVNLEPCMHQGRTPRCAPAIVAAGISRVVVAIEDPDERVAGTGIAHLRSEGIKVEVGVLAEEAALVNDAYLHQRRTGRPLMVLKLALSLDGKLAAADGTSRWITGETSRRHVHHRRASADGILIGAGTVLMDDPKLTARDVDAAHQPVRVLVDASGRVPPTARIFEGGETIVMTTIASPHPVKTGWKETGAEVVEVAQQPDGRVDLHAVIGELAGRGWLEFYCEGGSAIATSLLRDDLVDRLVLHYGSVMVGDGGLGIGDLGIETMDDAQRWQTMQVARMGSDAVITLKRQA